MVDTCLTGMDVLLKVAPARSRLRLLASRKTAPFCRTGLDKTQAEDLLDWLEANGYRDCRMLYDASRGFRVLSN